MNTQTFQDRVAVIRAANAQHTDSLPDLLDAANHRIRHLQSRIDKLMLEYCPHEMTTEQIANYALHQQPYQE